MKLNGQLIVAKYYAKEPHDRLLPRVVNNARYALNEKNDDFMVLLFGTTGSGKTGLLLWIEELYLGDEASTEYLALTEGSFAEALKIVKDKPLPRFLGNDEAYVSRRNALTKYNKRLLKTYMAIRGLRIFHAWCNPSIEIIDRPFIEERIKGFIFVATKDVNRPRVYYYFTKAHLLKLYDDKKSLKLPIFDKYSKSYAYYKGWFREYKGELLKDYNNVKTNRMDEEVEEFYNDFGVKGNYLSGSKVAQQLGVNTRTVHKYLDHMIDKELIKEGVEYRKGVTGRLMFTADGATKLREYAEAFFKMHVKRVNKGRAVKTGGKQ